MGKEFEECKKYVMSHGEGGLYVVENLACTVS